MLGTIANSQVKPQPFTHSQLTCHCLLQVLGTFGNGRIEAWIHMRPLKPEEMSQPQYSSRIAQRLAQFHAVNVKEPREPNLFKLILKWWGSAVDCHRAENPKQQAAACLSMLILRRTHLSQPDLPPQSVQTSVHAFFWLVGGWPSSCCGFEGA